MPANLLLRHQIAAFSALAAALGLALVPTAPVRALGLLGSMVAGGYGAATLTVCGKIRQINQETTDYRRRLESQLKDERLKLTFEISKERNALAQLRGEMTTEWANLQTEKQTSVEIARAAAEQCRKQIEEGEALKWQAIIAEMDQKRHQFETRAIAAAEAKLEKERQALAIAAENLREEIDQEKRKELEPIIKAAEARVKAAEADRLAKVKAAKAEARRREQFLLGEIEQLKELLQQRDDRLKEEFSAAIEPYEALYQELDQALAAYQQEFGGIQSEFNASYQGKLEEIQRLYGELRAYRNPAPFRGVSKADLTGNKLIDFYMSRGIVLDAERCEAKLDRSLVWVRPRATTIDGIRDHAEDLQLAFELTSKPEPRIDGGCVFFELKDARIELPQTITEPPVERLAEALEKANHVRINAPTDSGKSTLLDNVLNIYRIIYQGQMGLTLLDPKYPFTPWQGHSPDYKGFSECLGAMSKLSQLIEQRLSEARRAADKGEPIPSYEPHLFAIDELEILHDDALQADDGKKGEVTKALERALRTGLKVGRGLTAEKGKGIKVLYVTQSPLCTRIGLNRDDFEQSLNIYSGGNIALVLQDGGELDGKMTDAKRGALSREYEQRLAAGQKYILLVRLPNGGDTFLMQAPPPGYWHQKAVEAGFASETQSHTAAETVVTCPKCSSSNAIKNGRGTKGRTRRICKDCGTRFQA